MREEQLKNSTILFLSPLCARERNAPKEFEKEERRATESLERENLPSASDFALLLCSSPSCSAHRQLRKPSVRPSPVLSRSPDWRSELATTGGGGGGGGSARSGWPASPIPARLGRNSHELREEERWRRSTAVID